MSVPLILIIEEERKRREELLREDAARVRISIERPMVPRREEPTKESGEVVVNIWGEERSPEPEATTFDIFTM